jgi:hypothetical protein
MTPSNVCLVSFSLGRKRLYELGHLDGLGVRYYMYRRAKLAKKQGNVSVML